MSKIENDLVERFIVAFNEIDKYVRTVTGVVKHESFSNALRSYGRINRHWNREEELRRFAELRNFLVHEQVERGLHVAIPSESTISRIEELCRQMTCPEDVYKRFRRSVETVDIGQTLADVLRCIHVREYSQFPVYTNDRFVGLLTENGITRWISRHVSTTLTLVDLDGVTVREVISQEESKLNSVFVARETAVWRVKSKFSENALLEAVLVTQSGKSNEKLLGIATRWDMLRE